MSVALLTTLAVSVLDGSVPAHAQPQPGDILVVDATAGVGERGSVASVNPITGVRTTVTDFGNAVQGPIGRNPAGVVRIPTPSGAGLSGEWIRLRQHCAFTRGGLQCKLRGAIDGFNPGTEAAAPTVLQFFLSEDQILDADDVLLQEVTVGRLRPEQTRTKKLRAVVQGNARGLFVIAVLDATNVVAEINEGNNIVASPPIP